MEEGVLNDLDRLLSCEVSTMYTIRKNLSDKQSQRAEQLRNGKERPRGGPCAFERLLNNKSLATSVRQLH